MPTPVTLYTIAHGRSGDKGDAVNVGVIARRPEFYPFIKREITAARIGNFMAGMAKGPVERFEMDNIEALNFLLHGALGGGGSVGMQTDAQGKTYAHAALRMTVHLDDEMMKLAREHWGGDLPPEAFEIVDAQPPVSNVIVSEPSPRVRHVALGRAESRNALTLDLLTDLARALEPDPRRKVLILSGDGAGFCAGMDLREMLGYERSHAKFCALGEALYRVLELLVTQPCPVIAAVHGNALGGGAALALACDIVVAAPDAKFGFPETKIGFIPGIVSGLALRRLPGLVARELLLTGRLFDGNEAQRLGMVSFMDDQPVAKASALADAMVRENSGIAFKHSKNLLNLQADTELLRDMRAAVNLFAGRALEPCFQEAMASFAARKKVDWSEA